MLAGGALLLLLLPLYPPLGPRPPLPRPLPPYDLSLSDGFKNSVMFTDCNSFKELEDLLYTTNAEGIRYDNWQIDL